MEDVKYVFHLSHNIWRFANMTDMDMFVAKSDATIIESLKKIDTNKKDFL